MKIVTVSDEFDLNKILKSDSKIILDFFANWCGPCKILSKVIESVDKEKFNDVTLVKVNVDQFQKVSSAYNVRSLPTLVFTDESLASGERSVLKTKVGSVTRDDLEKLIGEIYEK